jgi:hypothetical protein
MRVRQLHPDRDPDPEPALPWWLRDLVDDDLQLPRL